MKNNTVMKVSVILSASMLMGFSAKIYSLADNVAKAEIILVGDVLKVEKDYVVMGVKKVIKGTAPRKEIEVAWDSKLVMEKIVPQYAVGEEYLLFTEKSEGRYEPFAGGQGAKRLKQGDREQYEVAIDILSKYHVAKSSEEVKNSLTSMLRSRNPLLQNAALVDFIYFDRDLKLRKSGIGGNELGSDVIALCKSSDRNIVGASVQVLGLIGGKSAIATLIDLSGSDDEEISLLATQALAKKTGVRKTMRRGLAVGERKKMQAEWKTWWEQNEDKVKIRP